jgi:hypothetical protein
MSYWDFDALLSLKDGDILFFDEVLNGNPTVLNACLTILEGRRMISGQELPDIMVVAAANPQGMVPLTPQIKERFVWYKVHFDSKMWIEDYMKPKFNITNSIGKKLANLIHKENFSGSNYFTARSVAKAVNMIINNVPTPYYPVIEPILSELVGNNLEDRVDLGNGKFLEIGEKISWLQLIRLKNGIITE